MKVIALESYTTVSMRTANDGICLTVNLASLGVVPRQNAEIPSSRRVLFAQSIMPS